MNKLPFEKEKTEILIKKNCPTDSNFGKKPEDRTIQELLDYGIVNINKPKGPTSHQVSDFTQKILGIEKAGHSGTLDPGVTGVLPIALGKSTKITRALLTSGKEYIGIMHLHEDVSDEKLNSAIKKFIGKIKQMPPIKSAVKRQWRTREIYYFDILERDGQDILFLTGVEAGTYIRKLVHDIGRELKIGAHMQQLIRTKAGSFDYSSTFTLHDLSDEFWNYKNNGSKKIKEMIQPIERAIQHLPKVWVCDQAVDSICHGAQLHIPGVAKIESNFENEKLVVMLTLKEELIGLARATMNSEEVINKNKGLVCKTETILMEIGVYPKFKQ